MPSQQLIIGATSQLKRSFLMKASWHKYSSFWVPRPLYMASTSHLKSPRSSKSFLKSPRMQNCLKVSRTTEMLSKRSPQRIKSSLNSLLSTSQTAVRGIKNNLKFMMKTMKRKATSSESTTRSFSLYATTMSSSSHLWRREMLSDNSYFSSWSTQVRLRTWS